MAGPEGYTGPTSGRITVGGDGEVVRERFTDPPLTRDEAEAVAWFTALSPNEQLREVRRMRWNLDEARKDVAVWRGLAGRMDRENGRLTAERDARRPDGYELPRAAAEILSLAVSQGWGTVRRWTVAEDGTYARLDIGITRRGHVFKLAWSVPSGGNGRGSLIRSGLVRKPDRDWHDAPSLKQIRVLLMADPD